MNNNYEELSIQMEMIDEFIEKAYDGMIIVDAEGIITKFKYEKVLGIKESDAIGKHVTKVIKNTRLHKVLKSGQSEIGDIQEIDGRDMVTARIPIKRSGKIIGAVGTIMFKDVSEVNHMSECIKTMKRQLFHYKKEVRGLNQAKYRFEDIITQDYHMMYLIDTAKRAASKQSTICIVGESGTGKEYFAHAIHNASPRKFGSFVTINCSAIPENLIESELFGYEAGAFTGASKSGKTGKFELANGGTIFLDEVNSLPLEMQAKLLRVLEEREFERIGGNQKIDVDVRIISASNEDLKSLVKENKFREDLYYRLDVISLQIPPLRERYGDITLLTKSILNHFNEMYEYAPNQISHDALGILEQYTWPGNVRELRNVIERAVNFSNGQMIIADDLPRYIAPDQHEFHLEMTYDDHLDLKHCVEDFEKKVIIETIRRCDGNKTEAAKRLGLHRTALYKKMDKLNMKGYL